MEYDPKNWYWIVSGDETRVFASARGQFVASDDQAYQAWVAQGGIASRILNAAELGEVLAQVLARPTDSDVLDGYRASHAKQVVDAVQFKIAFNQENRIRALEGRPALTPGQALAFVKAIM